MSVRWFDMEGQPITIEQAERLLTDPDARLVARTQVGEQVVSTVLLVLDHGWGEGPPVIFETMVFPECEACVRTSTKHAALAMHDQVVAEFQDQLQGAGHRAEEEEP